MTDEEGRQVETVFQLRCDCSLNPGELTRVLTAIRTSQGDLQMHTLHRVDDGRVLLCTCNRASEAALALREKGFKATTETAVRIRTEDRPGALSHLVRTVEAAGITVDYSYGSTIAGQFHGILRTDDNPKAEDALRRYLQFDG